MNELAKTEPDTLKTSNNLEIKYKLKISIFKKKYKNKRKNKIWEKNMTDFEKSKICKCSDRN